LRHAAFGATQQKGRASVSSDPVPASKSERPAPHSILEAGGEAVSVLLCAVAQSIAELLPGQVLEVVSSEPLAADAIGQWCREAGHELMQLILKEEGGQFWIRKIEHTLRI
jgi:TusA-related sulfurtransferase